METIMNALINLKFKNLMVLLSLFFFSFSIASHASPKKIIQNDKIQIEGENNMNSFYDLKLTTIDGKNLDLKQYKGHVLLIVNTASQCGFTPQFEQLEMVYQKYKSQGFEVLAIPSNDFKQDSAENSKIADFAKTNYSVHFTLTEKAQVRGKDKSPLFKYLTESKSGLLFKEVSWNFEKFLVNKKGVVVDRWSSLTKPDSNAITDQIEKALKEEI